LIAYASAYLKCHYLAAFTATTLNNQPMGFYQPMTIIKDAQRHGLKIKPIDITRSDWLCTVEPVELHVASCELQVAGCKLQVASWGAGGTNESSGVHVRHDRLISLHEH